MPKPVNRQPGKKRTLSKTFSHSGNVKKFIEKDYVLGYAVIGSSRVGGARVWPIYRGDVHVKTTDRRGQPLTHIFSTYEQGETLNGQLYEDPIGAQLAMIASMAISALDDMKRSRDYAKAEAKEKAKKAKRKS